MKAEHNSCKIFSDDLSELDQYKKDDSDSFGAIISSTDIRLVIIVILSIKITWNKKVIIIGGVHVYMCADRQ